jgi:hypothetical protein
MGLQGMSMITDMLGDGEKSAFYRSEAEKMAENWMNTAVNEDGTTRLAFDRPDSYSMKYNMVWDRAWKSGLFTQEFMDAELADNMKHFNKYGMPLDSRADYTKSDWSVWVTVLTNDIEKRKALIAPIYTFLTKSEKRVPFSDWYDTKTSEFFYFKNRTVQGGCFMPLLMK